MANDLGKSWSTMCKVLRQGALLLLTLQPVSALAQHAGHGAHAEHDGVRVTATGIVMNENLDRLPNGCDAISGEQEFTVHAGRRFAEGRPGAIFGMSQHEFRVAPCSRVTVHFVNEDDVRHQWMVHGLPKYLYPAGMFHIEAMGGQRQSGTFIAPAEDRNYLVHCDMAQHMEKGMRGQLVVGDGSGDLWAVGGISDPYYRSAYLPRYSAWLLLAACVPGLAFYLVRRRRRAA